MLSLNDPVSRLHLAGPAGVIALEHLGITTIGELLRFFPRDWQDLSAIQTVASIQPNEPTNIKASIRSINFHRSQWRRMHLTEAVLADETGSVKAVWFNQPFLRNVLKPDKAYYFSGKAQIYQPKGQAKPILQLSNPSFELVKPDTIHSAGIVPSYDLTEGITAKQMRYWQSQALPALPQITDYLPAAVRERLRLPVLAEAMRDIHFPKNSQRLHLARQRLAFDELFLFQLALLSFKKRLQTLPAPPIRFDTNLVKKFVAGLPFTLTNSQRLAAWEILRDMENSHPMNRLLEGEVGSGKTVVAGLAMLAAAQAGYQSVLLAPTEILAWQHYRTLAELFAEYPLPIALLTGSRKIGDLADIRTGRTKIVVGTHALLQEHVRFQKIGFLVVDEQHRFGVAQRSQLQNPATKTFVPHLLSMSATPIPRTLSLAFYGDLDISQLRQLPKGRKKIITRLVAPDKRAVAYEFIRKQLQAGRQMYVVTPLIEESDKLGVKSATLEAQRLQREIFPEFAIGLLHGRMRGEEKKAVMERFQSGQTRILVTTTVIEVGVDVANATIMLVENAERFGLAQLHQLRGRVGRSALQSFCLLFADVLNRYTKERLEAVVASTDGFALAEKDLELRGPGEIMGAKQSGFIPFRLAKLSDKKLIKLAKSEAEKLLEQSPTLQEFPEMKQKVEILAKNAHLE